MELYQTIFDYQFWIAFFNTFQSFGPLPPILLTFTEALIPMLPLVAIVTFNVATHGIFWGYLFSWIGSVCGAVCVFALFKFLRHRPLLSKLLSMKRLNRLIIWVSKQNRYLLFILTIFPFTPSFLINISFGLSDFGHRDFISTIIVSKAVMIAGLVLFGSTVVNSVNEPLYIILSVLILLFLYGLSLYIQKKTGADKL
ncbi:MAG: VTT domain-containing protein [Erysipelotrichaceae bacterium]|nr:VTT domain-containing protein [Erysipelotrichaceae bacterium]